MNTALSPFLPNAWYWKAGDGRVYSSASNAILAKGDPSFAAWSAGGNVATVWPQDASGAQTDASLSAVLTSLGLLAFAG